MCVCNSHDGNDICSSEFNGQGFTHVSVCATVVIVQYNRETRILPSAIQVPKMAPECMKTRLRASISQNFFWGEGMPPNRPSMGHLCGSHMGFLHKLGNPFPQILDPPLASVSESGVQQLLRSTDAVVEQFAPRNPRRMHIE